jgi:hypothetical protein
MQRDPGSVPLFGRVQQIAPVPGIVQPSARESSTKPAAAWWDARAVEPRLASAWSGQASCIDRALGTGRSTDRRSGRDQRPPGGTVPVGSAAPAASTVPAGSTWNIDGCCGAPRTPVSSGARRTRSSGRNPARPKESSPALETRKRNGSATNEQDSNRPPRPQEPSRDAKLRTARRGTGSLAASTRDHRGRLQ